jgi:hypothetical protein
MNIVEAYAALREGKRVRRAAWRKGVYLDMNRSLFSVWNFEGDLTIPSHIEWRDVAATDWEIVS